VTFDYRLRRGPFDPPPPQGIESLPIRLLGPFTVNFDDPDIGTDVHDVVELDPGLIVLNAWFLPTTEWSAGGAAHSFYIHVSFESGSTSVAIYEGAQTQNAHTEPEGAGPTPSILKRITTTTTGSMLQFEAYPEADVWTAGVADIYLLVGVPA